MIFLYLPYINRLKKISFFSKHITEATSNKTGFRTSAKEDSLQVLSNNLFVRKNQLFGHMIISGSFTLIVPGFWNLTHPSQVQDPKIEGKEKKKIKKI